MKFWNRKSNPNNLPFALPDRPDHPDLDTLEEIAVVLTSTVPVGGVRRAFDFLQIDEKTMAYRGLVLSVQVDDLPIPHLLKGATLWVDGFLAGALWARGDVDQLRQEIADA